jgi:hypothetical protein
VIFLPLQRAQAIRFGGIPLVLIVQEYRMQELWEYAFLHLDFRGVANYLDSWQRLVMES